MVAVQSLRRCILNKPVAQGLRKFPVHYCSSFKGVFLMSNEVCRTWTLLDSQFVSGRQVKSSIRCP